MRRSTLTPCALRKTFAKEPGAVCSPRGLGLLVFALFAVPLCGCTPLGQFIRNGLKVGPNYQEPPAPVATHWIDVADKRVRNESDDLSQWWTVFHDPVLDSLVCYAYRQNLTLQQAGFKVLTARAQRNMAIGNLFPQTQDATGDYQRIALSTETANRSFIKTRFFGQWDFAISLAWELDFW